MLYAIISDIHANLTALTAVLADIERQGKVEKIWCLGDIVGYGPDPHQCLELLRQTNHIAVDGNHDWGAIGKIDTRLFNPDAAAACYWTSQQLSSADTEYLGNLPLTIEESDFTLVHGSPREPIWEYLVSTSIAQENLAYFKTPFCLVGHSHIPLVFSDRETGAVAASQFSANVGLALGRNRLIINPGSVGQPRDGNPEASYAILDSDARLVRLRRVPYDFRATQDRMMDYGLPIRLAMRLSYGR